MAVWTWMGELLLYDLDDQVMNWCIQPAGTTATQWVPTLWAAIVINFCASSYHGFQVPAGATHPGPTPTMQEQLVGLGIRAASTHGFHPKADFQHQTTWTIMQVLLRALTQLAMMCRGC